MRRTKYRAGRAAAEMRLLDEMDPAPAVVVNAGARSPFLLVCDHAGRRTPKSLGDLGAPASVFEQHVAWDIGAGALSRLMARKLDACVIQQTYSRLVIDCNRAPDRADAIVAVSDGLPIPRNSAIDPWETAARIAEVHAPYHRRIAAELDERAVRGLRTVLVAIHSFTPQMNGFVRPWHVGVLHLGGSPFSHGMLASLRREPGLTVGDNEPYAMDGIDHTVPVHAIARGIDYLELEVRQDLIIDREGQARMAELLLRRLGGVAVDQGYG